MIKALKTYYSFLWRYKVAFFGFFVTFVIFAVLNNVQPYFFKLFVDNIPQNNSVFLLNIFIIYILVRIVSLIADVTSVFFGDTMLIKASRDARLSFFKKINELDFAYHISKKTGSLISAVKRGDSAFFNTHFILHRHIGKIIISLLVMIFFFLRLNIYLLLALFASMLVSFLISQKLIKDNLKIRKKFLAEDDYIMDTLIDNLNNFDTVKLFAKEKWEHKRLSNLHFSWFKQFNLFTQSFRTINISSGIIGNLSIFTILFLGLIQFRQGIITIGDYIMIVTYITSFYPQVLELIYEMRHLLISVIDLEKYFQVFDQKIQVPDPIHPVRCKNIKGKIEFKNVSFTYPDNNTKALNNFSLTIKPGQSVALVGKSGVGKTTISKLILRYYDVQQGEILLDDININRYAKSKLRSFIGVVPQEPILFNDTILYNIAYSKNKASKKQIISASKAAYLHEFIMSLPKKYDTIVGERGIKLSGGQRQRLAIARVILANPDIVLFDEATSQLDSISEKLIREALRHACKDKTTIIIAHRLSTISWVNKILVLDKGKVIESGAHSKLIKDKNSLYTKFWRLQSDHASQETLL